MQILRPGRAFIMIISVLVLAASCDSNGNKALDTTPDQAASKDVVAQGDLAVQDTGPGIDVAKETTAPEDVIGEPEVEADLIPDVSPDLPLDLLTDFSIPDSIPDVAEELEEDLEGEDCPGPDVEEIHEQCDPPVYSDDCLEVDYFQCGFEAYCMDGVLSVEWHEHVFCPGQEMEDIVGYSCTHNCDCAPVEYIDWANNGEELIAQACLPETDCPVLDPENIVCDDSDGWFWVFDGNGCVLVDGCTCGGCPGTYESEPACQAACGIEACAAPGEYIEVTLEDLIANPGAYDDQKISVVGEVDAPGADCDGEDCGPDNPCCNGCFGVYYFTESGDLVQVIQGEVLNVGCSGNECDWMDNCEPFEFAKPYRIWGLLEVGMMNTGALHVDGYCEP